VDELGKILKMRRKELGYSLEDVQEHLKYTKKAILDLEENTKSNFDDPLFFNLYLKKYAELLQLDFDALVDYYDVFERTQTVRIDAEELKKARKRQVKEQKRAKKIKIKDSFFVANMQKIIIVTILFIISYCIWFYFSKSEINLFNKDLANKNSEITLPNVEDNSGVDEDTHTTENDENKDVDEVEQKVIFDSKISDTFLYYLEGFEVINIRLEFLELCWVGIYNQDGKRALDINGNEIKEFSQSSGEVSFDVDGNQISVNLGNHEVVKMFVNGIEISFEEHDNNSYKINLVKR